MVSHPNDIVFTGYGVVSPIGIGNENFIGAIERGEGGIRLLDPIDGVHGQKWIGGAISGFEPKTYVQPRKSLKVMCIETQMAFAAASIACQDANLQPASVDPDRLGTVFGSEILFSEIDDILQIVSLCRKDQSMNHQAWSTLSMSNMYPLWMLKSLPNMPACHVGIWLDARGPNNTLTSDATSGLAALIEAAHVIQRGQADCMLVGAAGNWTSLTRMIQRYEDHYSRSYDNPVAACRPFDADRDGTVPSLGAAVVVLERRSHAEQRGLKPLGRLVSWSSTFGRPEKAVGGSSDAVKRAIDQALHRGQSDSTDIDHINTGGSGVVTLDAVEAQGIAMSQAADVPALAIKGFVGDVGCSAGLVELCASLGAIGRPTTPWTRNHNRTGADCPIDVIKESSRPWKADRFLKTNLTPHGQAAAVLIQAER